MTCGRPRYVSIPRTLGLCSFLIAKNCYEFILLSSCGEIRLQNAFLGELECDTLYHLGLDNKNHDLVKMFGDVRFVIMGGSSKR